jgi:hypothetical protein
MLFNEVEVLAAIEAAEEAQRQRTTKVDAHERQHTGGRKAISKHPPAKHFPRIEIEHDLPEAQRVRSLPRGMTRSGANIEKGPATISPSERNRIDSVARNPRRR